MKRYTLYAALLSAGLMLLLFISCPQPGNESIDLTPGAMTFTGDSVKDGSSLDITLQISNSGSGTVSIGFTVHFYLSEDTTFATASDTALGPKTVSSITGNTTINFSTALLIPDDLNITNYAYIYAVVDSGYDVAETDETNNQSAVGQAAYVLVYDDDDITRTYDVVIETFPPTASETTFTDLVLYNASGVEQTVTKNLIDGVWAQITKNGLSPGTYYFKVIGASPVQSGPYGISARLSGSYSNFGSALTGNGEDPYETDDSSTVNVPSNPALIFIYTPLNRYLAAGETDWFKFVLP